VIQQGVAQILGSGARELPGSLFDGQRAGRDLLE